MKNRKKLKIFVDILMTVLLFVLMGMRLTGEMWHEIAGTACFAVFIIHHILNKNWIKGIVKGKYPALRVLQTIINASLFVGIVLLMFSGMAMSGYVFKWLPLPMGSGTARSLHLITSYAVYLVMSMHIGMHFGLVIGKAGRKVRSLKRPWRGIIIWFSRIIAVGIAVYGLLALLSRKFLSYIFGQVEFSYFDSNESVVSFYLDYAAIMGLCIFLAYYVAKFLRPGFFARVRGIIRYSGEHKLKAAVIGVIIIGGSIAAGLYGSRYIKRHYIPVELDRAKAIGNETVDMGGRKGIVISFTRVGNTKFAPNVDAVSGASLMDENGRLVGNAGLLGDMAQSITGFDRYKITVERKYSSSYGDTVSEAREEMNSGYVPVFTGKQPDLSEYDTIILVYPLWWWTLPVPVEEYIKQSDLQGKTIYCLVTHGGSGLGSSVSDLKKITNGTVSDDSLTVMDMDVIDAFPKVLRWIEGWK